MAVGGSSADQVRLVVRVKAGLRPGDPLVLVLVDVDVDAPPPARTHRPSPSAEQHLSPPSSDSAWLPARALRPLTDCRAGVTGRRRTRQAEGPYVLNADDPVLTACR